MAGRRRAGPRTRTSAAWAGGSYQRSSEKPQKAMIGCVLCLVMFESLSQPRRKIGPDTQKIRKAMGSMRRFRTRTLAAPNQRWSYACCPGAKRTKDSSMFQLRKRDTGRIHDFPDSFGVPPIWNRVFSTAIGDWIMPLRIRKPLKRTAKVHDLDMSAILPDKSLEQKKLYMYLSAGLVCMLYVSVPSIVSSPLSARLSVWRAVLLHILVDTCLVARCKAGSEVVLLAAAHGAAKSPCFLAAQDPGDKPGASQRHSRRSSRELIGAGCQGARLLAS